MQCKRCILDNETSTFVTFDEEGVCNYCRKYDRVMANPLYSDNSKRQARLELLVDRIKEKGKGKPYDCILGLSGGVDSTYLAYLTKELGLRPLAVHFDNGWNSELAVKNIESIVSTLGIDLHTYVIDWEEFKDLQLSYIKASVIDIEVPTDYLIFAALYRMAFKKGIKHVISGNNYVTELIMPGDWNYAKFDKLNMLNIHKEFGTKKLKNFPMLGRYEKYCYDAMGYHTVYLLNLVDYEKKQIKELITNKLGWRDYGGKHFESVFTRFYQGYILPRKFNVDKRKAHLSNLICSGQITKEEALEELKQDYYPEALQNQDKEYVIKKFDLTAEEFDELMKMPPVPHSHYGSTLDHPFQFNLFRKVFDLPVKLLWKLRIFDCPYY